MKDELLEYILNKAGISLDEKEKYRSLVFGELERSVSESRSNIASIIAGAIQGDANE